MDRETPVPRTDCSEKAPANLLDSENNELINTMLHTVIIDMIRKQHSERIKIGISLAKLRKSES